MLEGETQSNSLANRFGPDDTAALAKRSHDTSPLPEASWTYSLGLTMMCSDSKFDAVSQENVMRKVLRGYAKGKDGDLIQIGTIPVPFAKANPLQGNAGTKDI